jgi:hypothetical protein
VSNRPSGEPPVPHNPEVEGLLPKFKNTFEFAVQNDLIQNLGSSYLLHVAQRYLKGQSSPSLTGAGENAYLVKMKKTPQK